MTPDRAETQEQTPDSTLSIGDLARRTGLSPATLRMWETRHGFPVARRLESGHRRYTEADVASVELVSRRRDAGVRLEVAIAEVLDLARPTTPSVFAELRRRHPGLATQRLKKSTLLALSWAIEDEFCARAQRARIFGGFQHQRYYRRAEPRWTELARVARSTMVFAAFDDADAATVEQGVTRVPLGPTEPMRREWVIVCDAVDLPVVLTAWEIPGQEETPERDRIFEAAWTLDPRAVRDAARVCAQVAQAHGVDDASGLLYELADDPLARPLDAAGASTLFNRVVAYVDRYGS